MMLARSSLQLSIKMLAGMNALKGNAIIALGNVGTDRAVDQLCMTLKNPEPQIRAYSAWALGKRGGVKAEEVLENAIMGEENPEVRKEIQYALGF